jgi:hypothetical protein
MDTMADPISQKCPSRWGNSIIRSLTPEGRRTDTIEAPSFHYSYGGYGMELNTILILDTSEFFDELKKTASGKLLEDLER